MAFLGMELRFLVPLVYDILHDILYDILYFILYDQPYYMTGLKSC